MAGPKTSGADFEQRVGQLFDLDEEIEADEETEEQDEEGESE